MTDAHDALGRLLAARLDPSTDADDPSADPDAVPSPDAERDDTDRAPGEDDGAATDADDAADPERDGADDAADADADADARSDDTPVRARSPLPLYVSEGLKAEVQDRYERFNAERVLDGDPTVQKHRHFMEGLLRAGLDNEALEAYVLDEFDGD